MVAQRSGSGVLRLEVWYFGFRALQSKMPRFRVWGVGFRVSRFGAGSVLVKKKSETSEQRSLLGRLSELKLRKLRQCLQFQRRQFEGSLMSPWRMQAVSNLYCCSTGAWAQTENTS